MTLDDLKAKLDAFSSAQVRFVSNIVDSLADPLRASVRPDTWITRSPDWIEYFSLALSVHHGATHEPLGLQAFETVFRNACQSVDWHVDAPGSATRRFVDMKVLSGDVPPRRLSLKSSAAMRLSRISAHISKLTEAAWIQDTRRPRDRRDRLQNLFRDYCGAVDAIIMLRAFRADRQSAPARYELLEIPTSIFASIQRANLTAFQADAPVIPCTVDGRRVAVVAVDRSDAKITVRTIQLSACIVHAEWMRSS